MTRRVYCTCFDHRYLPRGLALIDSLRRHGADDTIFVLCLNDLCFQAMTALAIPGVSLVQIQDLENTFPGLSDAKATRTTIEFYYTCSPAITEFALNNAPDAQSVAYLDADLWFFDSPDAVYAEIGDASTAIIPHNFAKHRKKREKFGVYNVGWVSFARSEEGMRCLRWWRESCVRWCYGRVEGDLFADQGYLSQFASIAPGTKVLRQKGANTAPWNIGNYRVSRRGDRVYVDDDPLVFFHFHGVDRDFGIFYFDNHRLYGAPHTISIRNDIYRPYIADLLKMEVLARSVLPEAGASRVALRGSSFLGIDLKNLRRQTQRKVFEVLDLASGRPILTWNDRAF